VQALNKFQSEVRRPLRGGDPGRRLIEPAQVSKANLFQRDARRFRPRDGECWSRAYHIFGSRVERLVAQRRREIPATLLALNPDDAARGA